MMKRIKYIVLTLLLGWMGCSSSPQNPLDSSGEGGGTTEEGTTQYLSIAALKSLYVNNAHKLTDVIFVSGTITANDYMGEYPNTLIIEDDTGAIEVSVDLEEQIYSYPIARTITINCTDLWLGSDGGTLMLGCESTGDYIVDPISLDDFERCATVDTESEAVAREAQRVTISQLSPQLVSCYLLIDGVRIIPSAEDVDTFCALDPDTGRRVSTIHTLEELSTGDQLSLYVPSTVDYANELLPTGSGSLYVTLELYGSSYSVRLVARRFYFD